MPPVSGLAPTTHGGHVLALAASSGRDPADILDFSASMNPLGPPDALRPIISRTVSDLIRYPDPDSAGLLAAASRRYGVPVQTLLAGNGTSDLLFALARAARGPVGPVGTVRTGGADGPVWSRAVVVAPCYVDYRRACERAGLAVTPFLTSPEEAFALDFAALEAALPESPALVFLGRPQNPTGQSFPDAPLRELAARRPDCLFVVDEAFADFVPDFFSLTRERPANVAVFLSLTKSFAVPGLRLGLFAADAALVGRVREELAPWPVNALAQAVGEAFLGDADFLARTRTETARLRQALARGLAELPGVRVFPSQANFLLCCLEGEPDAALVLRDRLLAGHGVAIRACADFEGLSGRFFRVAVRGDEDNARLLAAMRGLLDPARLRPQRRHRPPVAAGPRRTPAIMFQGTTSNAGKSVLAAALCRILRRRGLSVAPFKAQNMSLNSGVTPDGLEMGRAQILQARACGLAPEAAMNPVLLKPSSETGSQVIVLGRPVGNMDARTYFARKRELFSTVTAAYDGLAARHEVMVLEGAGSPAEINLMRHDIVNMAMAAHAGAAVLLVADIDRGGSFAALAGTMELLPEADRRRVAGFVLNRFRGDPRLLGDGPDFLCRLTGRRVWGVVPNIVNLELPEEDSVSLKAGGLLPVRREADLDVAVIDLPHLSNFTDCDALLVEPDTAVRLVRAPGEVAPGRRPDALILPGSKNTLADLAWLRTVGLDREIAACAASGRCEVVGICAGMQMLGDEVRDPTGLESGREREAGLGLLPLATELLPEKTLRFVAAVHLPSGSALAGYEIHHGTSRPSCASGLVEVVRREDGQALGHARPDGLAWGSYLHGLFDADGFRRVWLDGLRRRKGLAPRTVPTPYDLEPALSRLADVVEAHLDMQAVAAVLGL
ncbi:cobyric acid synthase [Desulfovibrio sulfodismutans]|uniref:Cobyric acid synthase n=2 Tax=Desulfolutivibrio sulfodismutans TaxID=63561 RepID=A0A7K3NHV0_9BACT|nr:cobyric acid synthase [Desulfolutivibrio sulfodismutans]QLA14530.1 cobyric acid synthase [Desulfolutivibrio sulfodismutans DSM 3696]